MKQKLLIFYLMLLFMSRTITAQDPEPNLTVFPSGITLKYGIGRYSLKDQYISEEKYSGTLPYLSFGWARKHDRYVYRLEMTYRESDRIKNNNVSTGITQLSLNQGFLYPLREMSLFRKDLFLWIGPSAEFYYLDNIPEIAVTGFEYAQSFAALLSLGLNTEGICRIRSGLYAESSVRLTLLSVGVRMVDNEEDNQSPVSLLTPFSGINASFDLGARYYILKRLSVRLAYRFEVTRISKWTPLLSASDILIAGLTYQF